MEGRREREAEGRRLNALGTLNVCVKFSVGICAKFCEELGGG